MRSHTALGLALIGLLTALAFPRLAPPAHAAAGYRAAECVQLIQNGGFESGDAGWQTFSAQGYPLISDFLPHTGELGAYLGGVNDADDRLSQGLALPPGNTLTLAGWWQLTTAETAGSFDTLSIALLRGDGTTLATLATLDNTATAGQWAPLTFDLSPYAGQSVTLRFAARTDSSNVTEFYLDDLSLWACAAGSTVTPTASATPTATTTLTATATPTRTATASPTRDGTPAAALKLYLPLLQR